MPRQNQEYRDLLDPKQDGDLLMALTNQYKNLSDDELRHTFLAAAEGGDGNAFFNSFQYTHQLYAGNYSATLNSGIDLLNRYRAKGKRSYHSRA